MVSGTFLSLSQARPGLCVQETQVTTHLFVVVLGIEPGALCILDKHTATEL